MGDGIGYISWPLGAAGYKNPVRIGFDWSQFGVRLGKKSICGAADAEERCNFSCIGLGFQACGENHHIDRYPSDDADERVLNTNDQLPLFRGSDCPVRDIGNALVGRLRKGVDGCLNKGVFAMSSRNRNTGAGEATVLAGEDI